MPLVTPDMPSVVAPRDMPAKIWAEKLKNEGVYAHQVIGEIISQGCEVKDYSEYGRQWKPSIVGSQGGRRMVFFNSKDQVNSPRFSVDVLSVGIQLLIDSNSPSSSDTISIVPYPRFEVDGQLNGLQSEILLLRGSQVTDLMKIFGMK